MRSSLTSFIGAAERRASITLRPGALPPSGKLNAPPARNFVAVRLHDSELVKPTEQRKEFMRLQRQSLGQVEEILKQRLDAIPEPKAWLRVVQDINRLAQTPKSGMDKLGGETALALQLALLDAGQQCDINLQSDDTDFFLQFAALAYNLHGLAEITMSAPEKRKLDLFAFRAAETFGATMYSNGSDFVELPSKERVFQMNRFMQLMATHAHELDLGLQEKDLLALQQQGITFETGSGGVYGSFVIPREGGHALELPAALQGDSSGLEAYLAEAGLTPDALLVSVIEAITHELVHAAQFSLYGAEPADMEQFARRATLMLSGASYFSLRRCYEGCDIPVLALHEMPAYETGMKLRDAICRLPDFEPSVKQAALFFTLHPTLASIAAQLKGTEPRKFMEIF